MNVSVHIPAEIESALKRRAQAAGQDVATFVQFAVTEKLAEPEEPVPAKRLSPEEFSRRLRSWIDLHPKLDHAIDDSRESIYEGRGE